MIMYYLFLQEAWGWIASFFYLVAAVIPALIRRFHEAKMRGDEEVVVWGTDTLSGQPVEVEILRQEQHEKLQVIPRERRGPPIISDTKGPKSTQGKTRLLGIGH